MKFVVIEGVGGWVGFDGVRWGGMVEGGRDRKSGREREGGRGGGGEGEEGEGGGGGGQV